MYIQLHSYGVVFLQITGYPIIFCHVTPTCNMHVFIRHLHVFWLVCWVVQWHLEFVKLTADVALYEWDDLCAYSTLWNVLEAHSTLYITFPCHATKKILSLNVLWFLLTWIYCENCCLAYRRLNLEKPTTFLVIWILVELSGGGHIKYMHTLPQFLSLLIG